MAQRRSTTHRQYFVIPAKERVKKSTHPANSSSFPRKRESRGGAHQTFRCFSCGNGRLDSRFRGNDEVLSAGYCHSLRRIFGGPTVICERRPISSHARKRESRGGARKTFRCFSCGNGRLDSCFRACEEIGRHHQLFVIPAKAGIQRRRAQDSPNAFLAGTKDWIPAFAGMTKYCSTVIAFLYDKSLTAPPLFVRCVQFLHTLFRGNDEELVVFPDFFTCSTT